MQCKALKKNGQRCGGGAMAGHELCGPHVDHPPQATIDGPYQPVKVVSSAPKITEYDEEPF